ncbi:PEP-CTERM sorting domain-containing protein [Rugamonas sp.]|uniref:PEP-CTERM sorting domain-containing protein n=1 Tax=Rugamonas sp. TaxID=1926287 RepID=UPI0025ED9717|nr:PEP-CTERM sorting domain-containing protein [Rugamonas sp.]
MKLLIKAVMFSAACALAATSAQAADYTVSAHDNSSTGGTSVGTLTLTAGETFTVSAGLGDLWSAGALPRWSNANGLTGTVIATGSDESGQPVGTVIGSNFGTWTENGYSAPYGSLVGEIGGHFLTLGAGFIGAAPAAGKLNLFYWDSNNADNTGSVLVHVNAVPEPGTYLMLGAGLLLLGGASRRRQQDKFTS